MADRTMELSTTERLAKLPPSPSSFTSIQRKSFTKISSMNGIPKSKIENNEIHMSHNVRRVPVIRSISTTPEASRPMSPMFGGSQHNGSLDRLDNFSASTDLTSSLRLPSRQSHKSLIDQCSSSSGYDSNSSSSLSYFSGANTNRRISNAPSYSAHSTETDDKCSKGSTETLLSRSSLARENSYARRLSYSERALKDEMVRTLDRLEKRVAFFREVAAELLGEKNKLLDALAQVNTFCSTSSLSEVDLQDIQATSNCMLHRLGCVDIAIRTTRSQNQMNALKKTNEYIDDLGQILSKYGKMAAKQRCLSYISSCSSDNLTDSENKQMMVPMDEQFQRLVIQCSLEDQKSIRKKLESVLLNIEK